MRSKNNQNISQLDFLDLLNQNIQHPELQQKFAIDVLIGLSHSPKQLPCKYIYDAQGSHLFGQIMKLPEYYLTNCETEILETHKRKIINTIGKQKLYPNDCGCFGPLGGRCADCGAISCRACHGRCAQCSKPICLQCTEFMDLPEAGARIRLCLQCHGKLARKRMLVKVSRLLLSPFIKIDR